MIRLRREDGHDRVKMHGKGEKGEDW